MLLSSGMLSVAQAEDASKKGDMTFFVTSAGSGKGADLGGLNGADQHCQTLAQRHGAGVEKETTDANEAYARFPDMQPTEYRDGWLP